MNTEFARHWDLDPNITFLNHGSFGATPRAVREKQFLFQDQLEREPVRFLVREAEPQLDCARVRLAQFLGCDHEDLVFVPNATHGVNTVLRSLCLDPDDELLVINHEYNACSNALNYVADLTGATVKQIEIPLPIACESDVVSAVLDNISPQTRLLLIDHVTSSTGLVLPLPQLMKELESHGVETLVDGAHAPGMLPLELSSLGATYYTGNCHKWMCSPKAVGFLVVNRARRNDIRPLVISHGANSNRTDKSRFHLEFDWMGTSDPSPILTLPFLIDYMDQLTPGGWHAIMEQNRALALEGRMILNDGLSQTPLCPESMIGSMACVRLRDASHQEPETLMDPLQDKLLEKYGIEVPIIAWPNHPQRLIRISTQLYNSVDDVEKLLGSLQSELTQ